MRLLENEKFEGKDGQSASNRRVITRFFVQFVKFLVCLNPEL